MVKIILLAKFVTASSDKSTPAVIEIENVRFFALYPKDTEDAEKQNYAVNRLKKLLENVEG